MAVPYRQTKAELDGARAAGAAVVDMEIATLFAAAEALDMRAAAAVVISDVSRAEGWESNWTDTAGPTQATVLNTLDTMRSLHSADT